MNTTQEVDYHQYYDLEPYLFNTVRPRFAEQGYLDAFDFFCIVIWKANRAKSKIAKKLLDLSQHKDNLDAAVRELTTDLAEQSTAKERLRCLWEKWQFYLPMASAILTVLYPDEFTIYDWRVCEELSKLEVAHEVHDLNNLSNFENLWRGYEEFKSQVEECTPKELSLRDKDRYLVGKSFAEQLKSDIAKGFAAN
jgi:hypothetical protein